MKETIFVTGGAGFIGSHVSENLLNQGYHVTCFDAVDQRIVSTQTVGRLVDHPNFRLVVGDLLDFQKLSREIDTADVVIHLAAISSVDRSIRNPHRTFTTNVMGTVNVLEAARLKGIKRVHFASTDEVYGHLQRERGQFSEQSQLRPRNPYAASKAAAEHVIFSYGTTYGMDVTATEGVNTYGPRQALEKLIPRLTVRGLLGKSLPVYGQGHQVREWLHVGDHAEAILFVAEHGKSGERYCVGSGEIRQVIDIVNQIVFQLGLNSAVIENVPDRPGSDKKYSVRTGKLAQLGWKAHRQFGEHLPNTIQWYIDHKPWWEGLRPFYPDLKAVLTDQIVYQYTPPTPSDN